MEDLKKNTSKPSSFRVTDDVKERFAKIATDEGWNQDQTLSKLIGIYEIEQAKMTVTERRIEIEEFEMHLHSLSEIYRMSLQLNQNSEERVREGFRATLESNQKTIQTLQAKIEDLESTKKSYQDMYRESMEKKSIAETESKRLAGELEKTDFLCKEYKDKNTALGDMLTEYKADREQMKNLQNEILTKDISIKKLQEDRAKLDSDLVLSKTQAESELKIALLDLKSEYQEKISLLKDEHNQEFKDMIKEIEMLRNDNRTYEKNMESILSQNKELKETISKRTTATKQDKK